MGTRQIGQLVDGLWNFAHLGRQSLNLQHIDLRTLIEEIIAEPRKEVHNREVKWCISDWCAGGGALAWRGESSTPESKNAFTRIQGTGR